MKMSRCWGSAMHSLPGGMSLHLPLQLPAAQLPTCDLKAVSWSLGSWMQAQNQERLQQESLSITVSSCLTLAHGQINQKCLLCTGHQG